MRFMNCKEETEIYLQNMRREQENFIHSLLSVYSLLSNNLWNTSRSSAWLYQAWNCLPLQSPVCGEQNRATLHFH